MITTFIIFDSNRAHLVGNVLFQNGVNREREWVFEFIRVDVEMIERR